jgi:hypothetical protein
MFASARNCWAAPRSESGFFTLGFLWRLQYFGTSDNTGAAADDADPDHDRLTNFTEFAFGLSPVDRASNALPEFKHDGTSFTATFTALEGSGDVIYGAEWSATMQPGTWTKIRTPAPARRTPSACQGKGEKRSCALR